jgi:hypothetical protein
MVKYFAIYEYSLISQLLDYERIASAQYIFHQETGPLHFHSNRIDRSKNKINNFEEQVDPTSTRLYPSKANLWS